MAQTHPGGEPRGPQHEGELILPFRHAEKEVERHTNHRWDFTTEVRSVSGTEGDWLRRELL
jgi:hypothetical protein